MTRAAIAALTIAIALALGWLGLWPWVYGVLIVGAILWAVAMTDDLHRCRVRIEALERDVAALSK